MLLATTARGYSPFIEAFYYLTKRKKSTYSLCPSNFKARIQLKGMFAKTHQSRYTRIFLAASSIM